MQNAHRSLHHPNKDLSDEEKRAKRDLKKQLKRQVTLRKLENRLRQALGRKDEILATKTRAALKLFLEDQAVCIKGRAGEDSVARSFVENVYHELQYVLNNEGRLKYGKSVREHRTEQARELLQNMSKGTQTASMFDNEAALMGYVRQKFIERAMLIASSLGKLRTGLPQAQAIHSFADHQSPFLGKLTSVRSVCSVGCGPGCDVVGITAFLRSLASSVQLEKMILLDWAVDQWKIIVQPLEKLLVPACVKEMFTATCDVRFSLFHVTNAAALRVLSYADGGDSIETDLIVTSYLLSETHGKWHTFFDDLVARTKPGTLFLFTDPTAWQLHSFMERTQEGRGYCMEFIWLDSSSCRPELQVLEGRVGPAVLLGMKRSLS